MSVNIAFSRPAGAAIVLVGVTLAGTAALTLAWQDHAALVEERDAKVGFVARGLAPGRARTGIAAAASEPLAVKAESATLAAAAMDALVRSRVAEAGGVVLSSRAETKTGETPGDPNERIEIEAVVQARMEALQAALFRLETGRPLVLVDRIGIRVADEGAGGDPRAPTLTATLTLTAFRARPAPPSGGAVEVGAGSPP